MLYPLSYRGGGPRRARQQQMQTGGHSNERFEDSWPTAGRRTSGAVTSPTGRDVHRGPLHLAAQVGLVTGQMARPRAKRGHRRAKGGRFGLGERDAGVGLYRRRGPGTVVRCGHRSTCSFQKYVVSGPPKIKYLLTSEHAEMFLLLISTPNSGQM